jgi:hypothetical protein
VSNLRESLYETLEIELHELYCKAKYPDSERFTWMMKQIVELRLRVARIQSVHPCRHDITSNKTTLKPIIKPRATEGASAYCTSCGNEF